MLLNKPDIISLFTVEMLFDLLLNFIIVFMFILLFDYNVQNKYIVFTVSIKFSEFIGEGRKTENKSLGESSM